MYKKISPPLFLLSNGRDKLTVRNTVPQHEMTILRQIFDTEDDGRFGAFVQNGDFREGGLEGGVLCLVRQNDHGDGTTGGVLLLRDGGDGDVVFGEDAGDLGEHARLVHDL